jgi:predicted amidohydrolase
MKIAAVQGKAAAGDVTGNVQRHARIAAQAADHGVNLVIFPELSLTGYELHLARGCAVKRDDAVLDPLRAAAARSRIVISAGAPLLDSQGRLYIAALLFRPDEGLDVYTKVHVHSSERHVFDAGSGSAPMNVAGAPVAWAICADASHQEHAAQSAERGARIYAVSAMIDGNAYARKAALLQGYARDHAMVVLLANYCGVTGGETSAGRSAIWSNDGSILAQANANDEALVIAEAMPAQTGTASPLVISLAM